MRAGLYWNDIVPRDPVHGRGSASSYRPCLGVGAIWYASHSDRGRDCPADLIPGVLVLYPQLRGRESNPLAVVVPECRVRYSRTTGASLLVAPAVLDVCEGDSTTGCVVGAIKCVRTRFLSALLAPSALVEDGGSALPRAERTVFHVPESDEGYAERAFGNAANLLADDTVEVEVEAVVVANGDGIAHLLADAPTADRIRELLEAGVDVCACANTIRKRDEIAESDLVDGVDVVSSGMAELTRRQSDGYAYVRP